MFYNSQLDHLLDQIKQRNTEALGELYDLTVPYVYKQVLEMTSDPLLAETITCDVYTRVWSEIKQLTDDSLRTDFFDSLLQLTRQQTLHALNSRQTTTTFPTPVAVNVNPSYLQNNTTIHS